jgi:hypothetical protein
MSYDYENARWQSDIKWFGHWKALLERVLDREGEFYDQQRERLRRYLREIQKRWPQYIKDHEIP